MSASPSERRMILAAQASLVLIVSVCGALITTFVLRVFAVNWPYRVTVQITIPVPVVCAQCAEYKEALDRCGVSWDEAFGGPHAGKQPNSQCEQQLAICHREWSDMFERQYAHDTDAAVPSWVAPLGPCPAVKVAP